MKPPRRITNKPRQLTPKEGAVLARLSDEPHDEDGWFHVDSKRYANDCRIATSTVGYALGRFRVLGLIEATGWGASRLARITEAGHRTLADFLGGSVKRRGSYVVGFEYDRQKLPAISGDGRLRAMVRHLRRADDTITDWPGYPGLYRLNHYKFPVDAVTLARRAANFGFGEPRPRGRASTRGGGLRKSGATAKPQLGRQGEPGRKADNIRTPGKIGMPGKITKFRGPAA